MLQQEMDSSEVDQALADAQAQLSERDSRIASLETEVRTHTLPHTCLILGCILPQACID